MTVCALARHSSTEWNKAQRVCVQPWFGQHYIFHRCNRGSTFHVALLHTSHRVALFCGLHLVTTYQKIHYFISITFIFCQVKFCYIHIVLKSGAVNTGVFYGMVVFKNLGSNKSPFATFFSFPWLCCSLCPCNWLQFDSFVCELVI